MSNSRFVAGISIATLVAVPAARLDRADAAELARALYRHGRDGALAAGLFGLARDGADGGAAAALAAIAVDTAALRALCAAYGADQVFCYSFDTLTQAAAVHGRPVPLGEAHPVASASGALACISALRSVGALGGTPEPAIVEQGDHRGRPTRMAIDTSESPRIGGAVQCTGALTVDASVPEDTILE